MKLDPVLGPVSRQAIWFSWVMIPFLGLVVGLSVFAPVGLFLICLVVIAVLLVSIAAEAVQRIIISTTRDQETVLFVSVLCLVVSGAIQIFFVTR